MMVSQNIAETVKGIDVEFHVHFPTMIDDLPFTFISICYSKQKLIKVFKKIFKSKEDPRSYYRNLCSCEKKA